MTVKKSQAGNAVRRAGSAVCTMKAAVMKSGNRRETSKQAAVVAVSPGYFQ